MNFYFLYCAVWYGNHSSRIFVQNMVFQLSTSCLLLRPWFSGFPENSQVGSKVQKPVWYSRDYGFPGWMESCLLNVTESISRIAFWPYESDLLKDAEIFTAMESHLRNGADLFLLWEWYLLKLAQMAKQKWLYVVSFRSTHNLNLEHEHLILRHRLTRSLS